jgi:hypothetical protein
MPPGIVEQVRFLSGPLYVHSARRRSPPALFDPGEAFDAGRGRCKIPNHGRMMAHVHASVLRSLASGSEERNPVVLTCWMPRDDSARAERFSISIESIVLRGRKRCEGRIRMAGGSKEPCSVLFTRFILAGRSHEWVRLASIKSDAAGNDRVSRVLPKGP